MRSPPPVRLFDVEAVLAQIHAPLSSEQIGKEFSVTRERIRQIECRAIRKLKDPERNSIIADYTQPMPVDN